MDDRLRAMVTAGATVASIARELGIDRSTARRWLVRAGLETRHMATLRRAAEARAAGARQIEGDCPRHGRVTLRLDARGTFRCLRCRSERVAARRRRIKELLLAEAGGACALCGYDRCIRALEFHHVDPASKEFAVAQRGHSRSLARARREIAKCVLLCSNCHAEVEAGLATLP